mmetsp:Transcript_118260/g.295084  ORF Transcript_118260/g.295084 Transcript_118260/m.295084 type:complete len:228 (-) Transcript_118260:400-1083(-)
MYFRARVALSRARTRPMKLGNSLAVISMLRARLSCERRSAKTEGSWERSAPPPSCSSGSVSPSGVPRAKFTNVLRTAAFSPAVSGSNPRSSSTARISGSSRVPLPSSSYLENAWIASSPSRSFSAAAMRAPSARTRARDSTNSVSGSAAGSPSSRDLLVRDLTPTLAKTDSLARRCARLVNRDARMDAVILLAVRVGATSSASLSRAFSASSWRSWVFLRSSLRDWR